MARLAPSRSKNQEQAEGSERQASRGTPPSGFTSGILELQQMTGNQAVSRLLQSGKRDLARSATASPIVREVLQSSGHPLSSDLAALLVPPISREHDSEHEHKATAHVSGKSADKYEREAERSADEMMVGPQAVSPDRPASSIEPQALGLQGSFDDVRIHTDARAAEAGRLLHANAFTVGRDIAFGKGKYAPHTAEGRRLLAHEFTHVAQQRNFATPVVQFDPDDKTAPAKDAETLLGEKLWSQFPNGVTVGFYDAGLDEAKRRAADWATDQNAIGFKGSKISADEIVFGKAIPDTLKVGSTITALGKVLDAAVAKAPAPSGAAPAKGMGPTKVAILGIFSHGTERWCGIGGGLTTTNAAAVVKAIAPVVTPNLKVLLYSCSGALEPDEPEAWVKGTLEGGGAGSVAAKVRDALVEEKISEGEVWGHTTVGHVTENFALRFFTAASGKGTEGFAYAAYYVWGMVERVNFQVQLQRLVEEKGYVVDDKSSKRFFSKSTNETNKLLYRCYAEANKDLTYNGKNLATMAPLHPREVAKVIHDHWDANYWTTDKKDKLADKLIKNAKLKKVADTAKAGTK